MVHHHHLYGRFHHSIGSRWVSTTNPILILRHAEHPSETRGCVGHDHSHDHDHYETFTVMDNANFNNEEEKEFGMQQDALRDLVTKILSVTDPNHIPSLLTKHIPSIVSWTTGSLGVRVVESILKEAKDSGVQETDVARVEEAIDLIVSFGEEFTTRAKELDTQNKELLGKLIRAISEKELTTRQREESFDQILRTERFTPGFLRHLQGECRRIQSSAIVNEDTARLLELLHIIQTRVLEEMGKDLGEAAQVLGQLVGYDERAERLAVLEAGLMVRGQPFAHEMLTLSCEALDGFKRHPDVDPGLVSCVEEIRDRLRSFAGYE